MTLIISSLSGGGAERVLSRLAGHWARAGHDVSVVTLGSRETDFYALERVVRRIALDLVGPSRSIVEAITRGVVRLTTLRRTLHELRPDVVVSFMDTTNVLSLFATLGTGVPVFVCERTDPRHEPVRLPWVVLRRWLYPRAAGVVVQTESVRAWARRFCRRVHVIPNFVEPPQHLATPGATRGPRRLIAMGRLGPEKGFDLLLQAFAQATRAQAHPDWSLTILGEGRDRAQLEELVGHLHLDGRVSMPGHVADPMPYLGASHAFVLSSRHEGFPNALLEAMACGLPVVAFDCPSGPGEIITHGLNGLLVAGGDVAGLAAALERVMASAPERISMGHNAREIAITLSPERVLARWSALLKSAWVAHAEH